MEGKQLSLAELKTGDVLLFEDVTGATTHFGIAVLQAGFSHHWNASSNVTHAGLYDETGQVICEASGAEGLRRAPLAQKHRGYKYQVWRCIDGQALGQKLPTIAIGFANIFIEKKEIDQRDFHSKGGGPLFGGYDTPGGAKAVLGVSSKGAGAKSRFEALQDNILQDRLFYCSNFVVECYEFARTQVVGAPELFNLDFQKVMPKDLQGAMRNAPRIWRYEGNYLAEGTAPSLTVCTKEQFMKASSVRMAHRYALLTQIDSALEAYHKIPLDHTSRPVLIQNIPQRQQQLETILKRIADIFKERPQTKRAAALNALREQAETDLSQLAIILAQNTSGG